jgi:hypothetical protein
MDEKLIAKSKSPYPLIRQPIIENNKYEDNIIPNNDELNHLKTNADENRARHRFFNLDTSLIRSSNNNVTGKRGSFNKSFTVARNDTTSAADLSLSNSVILNRSINLLTVSRTQDFSIIKKKDIGEYRVRISVSPEKDIDITLDKTAKRQSCLLSLGNNDLKTLATSKVGASMDIHSNKHGDDSNIKLESIEDVHINFVKLIARSKSFIRVQENEDCNMSDYNTVVHFDEVDIV